MAKKYPLVSIIVPAFRSEFFITNLIKDIKRTRYKNYEVVIVFDPSGDKGPEIARHMTKKDKRWHIVENRKRLGSTKSLNLGIKKSKGTFIAFAACDMSLDPGWIGELMRFLLKADDSVGGAIAKFYDYHQHDRIQVYRHYLMPQTGWIVSLDLGKKDGPKYQKTSETFNGFEGLVVRLEVFEKAGTFDEDVDALIYDLDMHWRVWLAGYRIILVPTAKVFHWSIKEGRQNEKWEFFYGRMMNIFIKNYSLRSLCIYLPQFIAIYTTRAFILLLRGNATAIRGWSQAVIWSIKYLPKTLRKRAFVQNKVRRVSDDYLFKKIFYTGSIVDFYKYLKNAKQKISPVLLNKDSSIKEVVSYSAK